MFNIGQQFFHNELETIYRVDNVITTNKGNLYTLVAENYFEENNRYKRYYEEKLKEKCKIVEELNG